MAFPGCSERKEGTTGHARESAGPPVLPPAELTEHAERYQRGVDLAVRGFLDRARPEFERCLELKPRDPKSLYQLGKIALFRETSPVRGRQLLEEAFELDPGSARIGRLLVNAYRLERQRERAAHTLRQLVKAHPEDLEFVRALARDLGTTVFRLPGDFTTRSLFEERAALLERAIDSDPQDGESFELLAETYLDMGDFEQARELYTQYLNIFLRQGDQGAKVARALQAIGVCCLRAGKKEAALRFFTMAMDRLQPGQDVAARWHAFLACSSWPQPSPVAAYPSGLDSKYKASIPPPPAAAPSDSRFTNVAREAGVSKLDGAGPTSWGDLDGDGLIDLFVSGCNTFSAVYLGNGNGTFRNATREAGLMDLESSFGALLGDHDNDGDLDLYLVRDGWFGRTPNALYQNDGHARFTDVTAKAGVGDEGSGFTGAFGDYDCDGWLDIAVANGVAGDGSKNVLYHNRGDGTFENVTEAAGLREEGDVRTIGIAFFDFDKDGDLDVAAGGYTCRNRLFRNQGDKRFEEIGRQAGMAGSDAELTYMVLPGDLDNDSWPDLICTQYEHSYAATIDEVLAGRPSPERQASEGTPRHYTRVFRNLGDGKFSDETVRAGFRAHGTMGANLADLDNDGFLDIYMGTGGPRMDRLEPNALYHNNGDGTFTEIGFTAGVADVGKGHGISFADYDRDGDLDIYSSQGGAYHGDLWENCLFRNDSRVGHWISVRLVGTVSNRDGAGAKITVRAAGRTVYREMSLNSGFGSTNSPEVEIGLGDAPRVESLTVLWPSGILQELRDLPANQSIVVREEGKR